MLLGEEAVVVLPGADKAVIPKEKFISYALNEEREPKKAKAFKTALGYDASKEDQSVKIELFDRIHLKNGKTAHIVEIYEQGVAYEADIALDDGEYSTDTIRQSDILYVYADPAEQLRAI